MVLCPIHRMISIHAPREGSDRSSFRVRFLLWYFYPRSPRGERRHGGNARGRGRPDFYPRSPRGERLLAVLAFSSFWLFLSTLPARGATGSFCRAFPGRWHFYPRSPRGERQGDCSTGGNPQNFYPRSPRGERPRAAVQRHRREKISIHAPREGSDKEIAAQAATLKISIHAPREGSDRLSVSSQHRDGHFYPRSPRGERLYSNDEIILPGKFLSTLPARGATPRRKEGNTMQCISIHAPREGSDSGE